MSNASDPAKRLDKLIKTLERQFPEVEVKNHDPIDELIFSLLLANTISSKAELALEKLLAGTVDYNDLRVTLTPDLLKIIGERYSKGAERIERIRAALTEVYSREYDVTLDNAASMSKRDARMYLESLEGMTPFAAARVLLLCIGGHAIPVDDQLLSRLRSEGIFDEDTDIATAQSFMERNIKAADSLTTYLRLQAWSESAGSRSGRSTAKANSRKKPASNKAASA